MQPESLPKHHFTYQTLDVYQLAVKVNRWFGRARFPRGRSALRDQGQRAADAMVCNICLLYTSPSPRDRTRSRMPSSA